MNLIVTRARKIYSTAAERTLTAILSITHTRICKGMSVKCINPSFINRSSTSILPIMNCRKAKRVIVMTAVIRYLLIMTFLEKISLSGRRNVFANKDRIIRKKIHKNVALTLFHNAKKFKEGQLGTDWKWHTIRMQSSFPRQWDFSVEKASFQM